MTATAIQNKDALKALLIEIANEDPTFFNHLVQKTASDNAQKEVEQIMNETFEEYDDVFKALA